MQYGVLGMSLPQERVHRGEQFATEIGNQEGVTMTFGMCRAAERLTH